MNGVFGALIVWDNPFVKLPLKEGQTLHLPCGTVPTALIENAPIENGQVCTTVVVAVPGSEPLSWVVELTALEAQEVFREGAKKLNRVAKVPEAIPFKP